VREFRGAGGRRCGEWDTLWEISRHAYISRSFPWLSSVKSWYTHESSAESLPVFITLGVKVYQHDLKKARECHPTLSDTLLNLSASEDIHTLCPFFLAATNTCPTANSAGDCTLSVMRRWEPGGGSAVGT
jgi:hypothetical protein